MSIGIAALATAVILSQAPAKYAMPGLNCVNFDDKSCTFFGEQLEVTVEVSAGGVPVPNARVTFAIEGTPKPAEFANGAILEEVFTGEDGRASSSQITPVRSGVTFQVTATETHIGPAGQASVELTVAP